MRAHQKMSVGNKFPATLVSQEAGSVIYKGDRRSRKGKMGVFNQVACKEWERNHTRFQKIHFYWVTGNIKKLLPPLGMGVAGMDFQSSLLNGGLF